MLGCGDVKPGHTLLAKTNTHHTCTQLKPGHTLLGCLPSTGFYRTTGGGKKRWRETVAGDGGGKRWQETVAGDGGGQRWRETVAGDGGGKRWREMVAGNDGGRCWRETVAGNDGGRCWRNILEAERAFGTARAESSSFWHGPGRKSSALTPTCSETSFRLGAGQKQAFGSGGAETSSFRPGPCRQRTTFQIFFQPVLLLEIPV